MKKIILIMSILTSMLLANDTYKKCVGCHGVNGEKKALGKSLVIADMNSTEIVTALNGYKDGTYGGPMKSIMKGQVAKLTQEEIEEIATYISKKVK